MEVRYITRENGVVIREHIINTMSVEEIEAEEALEKGKELLEMATDLPLENKEKINDCGCP